MASLTYPGVDFVALRLTRVDREPSSVIAVAVVDVAALVVAAVTEATGAAACDPRF